VWRDNRYPGCACDVQSHLYSFSFAPNPAWTRRFPPQAEILAYLARCADEFGVRPHIRFGTDVERAEWNAAAARWTLTTSRGVLTADVLVAAPGALSEPRLPEVPGLETFGGNVFHSARWDASAELAGKRVAVVGTGASAIQIVPAIQPVVSRLVLFQRTPPWVMPRHDAPIAPRTRRWMDRVPPLRRAVRGSLYGYRELFGLPFRHPRLASLPEAVARRHLRAQVPDPALRRLLTPTYAIGCKRILLSDDYYPALTQPNVRVVPTGLAEVRADAAWGEDGVPHAVDAIIFATGFHVTDFPFAARIRGAGGKVLSQVWGASPKAHLGTTVAGFPNLFILAGPNTGLGHTSVLLMMEAQVEHVLNALEHMRRNGLAAVAPVAEAQAAWTAEVDRRMEGTVWTSGGCRSWYLDETGRNSTLWPGSVGSFVRRVRPFQEDEYHLYPPPRPHVAPTPPADG
jgi:cation diffusion facilitator CzcD-associated flavoprotein CzcO